MVTRGFAYLYTHKNADALELALKLDGRRFRKETISAQLSENVIFLLSGTRQTGAVLCVCVY